jgi:hypothetical protein
MGAKSRCWLGVLFLFAAAGAAQAQADYFPLQPGNQWIYRGSGGSPYALVHGLPGGDAWLRMGEDQKLFAWDTRENREKLWVDFAAAEGQSYATEIDPCTTQAVLSSRRATYEGPIGYFDYALAIRYPAPSCADAGLTSELYLPYVGLVRRAWTTIAGERSVDLVYARLGGVTVISENEAAFSLTVDRSAYEIRSGQAPTMTARLTLRHTEPLRLTFPSGQTYDLALKNERGEEVYRWSRDKAFTLAIRSVEFPPGEQNWVVLVPLIDVQGRALPAGRYAAEGWLTTAGPRAYAAGVGFEIREGPSGPGN